MERAVQVPQNLMQKETVAAVCDEAGFPYSERGNLPVDTVAGGVSYTVRLVNPTL